MADTLTFGSDPETFWVDSANSVVCPHLIVPDHKKVHPLGDFGGYNRDGIAFELNPSPAENGYVLAQNIIDLLDKARDMMPGLKLLKSVVASIPNDPMMPNDVWELGCDPDLNAYKVQKIRARDRKSRLRFAGGHLMVGLPRLISLKEAFTFARLCDVFVGVNTLKYSMEGSKERRQVYGKAGSFRFRPEKKLFEYRTPDAGWLLSNHESLILLASAMEEFVDGFYGAWDALNNQENWHFEKDEFSGAQRMIDNCEEVV